MADNHDGLFKNMQHVTTMLDQLERLRRCVIDARKLCEQLEALSPAPAPIALDGLPHGTGGGGSIERLIDARDLLTRKLHDRRADARALYLATEPFLYNLPGELYVTAVSYYVDGYTVQKTAEIAKAALRTTYDRLSRIRRLAARKEVGPGNPEPWR